MSKNFKHFLCPYSEQKWHGVLPSISLAFISAPLSIKAYTTGKIPRRQDMWSGVLKLLVLASTYAPNLIKISMSGAWLSLAARWSGVNPSEFVQLTIWNISFSPLNYN